VKGEASAVLEEMEEEAVGIAGSSSKARTARRPSARGNCLLTSPCKEDNNRSGLQFITIKSDQFLPPKSETEGSDGPLLAPFQVYSLFPSSHR
jgi:hypothetical protein